MFNYFSNYKYQANDHSARSKQVEDNIRREIYRFEMTPKKNEYLANEVINEIDRQEKQLVEPYKNNSGFFNPYMFIAFATVIHLRGIRKFKKNLNEMELPITFCVNTIGRGILYSTAFTLIWGKNLRNYVDSMRTHYNIREITYDFSERYGKFY